MHTFYIIFAQTHPLRDGWVEVEAENESDVRLYAKEHLGAWAGYYDHPPEPRLFPLGKVGRTIIL